MFKKLFELWHKENLLNQALSDASEMLTMAYKLFRKAVGPLFFGEETEVQDVYDIDKQINTYEVTIRKKVMEHLSVSPQQDTTAALVLTTIAVDIERIGDYCKNFLELWELYGGPFENAPVFERLKSICENTIHMFELTDRALSEADSDAALKVMEIHISNSKDCEEIIAALVRTPGNAESLLAPNQEVLAALTARYMKRTSAHLKNIASSVINPFDRIGYKPPEYTEF